MKLKKLALTIISVVLIFFICGNFTHTYAANETIINEKRYYFKDTYTYSTYDFYVNEKDTTAAGILNDNSYYSVEYVKIGNTYQYRLTIRMELKDYIKANNNYTIPESFNPYLL